MKGFYLFISICFIGLVTNAQTEPHPLHAEQAYEAGMYDLALYELNRAVFNQGDQANPDLYKLIGHCYMQLDSFELAANFYDLYYFNSEESAQKSEAVLLKTKSLIAQEQPALALTELLTLPAMEQHAVLAQQYYLYMGLCQFELEDFKGAEVAFLKCTNDTNAIKAIFAKSKSFYRPNSSIAMIMSAVVPGLGQLYANEYQESLNSLLINAVFIAYTIRISRNLSTLDAFISVLPWFQRYYAGGYNKASDLAYARMLEKRKMKLGEILNIIEASPPANNPKI